MKKLKNISNKFDPLDKEIDDNKVVKEFCREYIKLLKELTLDVSQLNDDEDPTEFIIHKLDEYTPLRDEFITFFEEVLTHDNIDSEIIIKFLIDIFSLSSKRINEGYNPLNVAHYHFILREMLFYLISIAVNCGNYSFLDKLFNSEYSFEEYQPKLELVSLRKDFSFVDLYNVILIRALNKNSSEYNLLFAESGKLMKNRLYKDYTINDIAGADLLCYYIQLIQSKDDESHSNKWFSFTAPYYTKYSFDFFTRLNSKKYFEKVKGILNVESVGELKKKIIKWDKNLNNRIINGYKIPLISESINLDDICTKM